MTDLAAAGPAQWRNFTDREWREVVVHHEAFVRFAFQPIHALNVVRRSECCRHKRLRFTPRENRRTMSARQNTSLDPNGPDGFEVAFIRSFAFVQNLIAEDPFF